MLSQKEKTISDLNLLLPAQVGLVLETIESNQAILTFNLSSTSDTAQCPLCGDTSAKIQSRYQRKLNDLPWANHSVQFVLQTRRFFCHNPNCERKVFCERLDQLTSAYARQTTRLNDWLSSLAFALGGRPGARLASKQGLSISRHKLLRIIRHSVLPNYPTPRILGVDDWARRKGHTYGTLLVDLEQHRPFDVLADRSSQTLAAWLKTHPGIEVVSRDRAGSYAEGISLGLPQALQVADRFHILVNLRDHLQDFFQRKKVWQYNLSKPSPPIAETVVESVELSGYALSVSPYQPPDMVGKPKTGRLNHDEQIKQQNYHKRLARYEQIVALSQEGLSTRQIAAEVGMDHQTVHRYLRAGSAEVIASHPRQPRLSIIDAHKAYLWQRWVDHQPTIEQLHSELSQQGYTGSIGPIRAYLASLRPQPYWSANRTKVRRKLNLADIPAVAFEQKLSSRAASWLIFKLDKEKEELTQAERQQLKLLLRLDEQIALVYELVQQFRQMVRTKCQGGIELSEWLKRAKESKVKELVSFVRGIEIDFEAVEAGLTLDYNNGQLEGQINRLKTIKKQMYGRAGFDLLRARMLAAA